MALADFLSELMKGLGRVLLFWVSAWPLWAVGNSQGAPAGRGLGLRGHGCSGVRGQEEIGLAGEV